jgi:hypothetical protein
MDERPFDEDQDRETARRQWEAMLADVDAEIRDDARPEAIEERRLAAQARERWRALPPVRLRPGVAVDRLTDQEAALLDREGY